MRILVVTKGLYDMPGIAVTGGERPAEFAEPSAAFKHGYADPNFRCVLDNAIGWADTDDAHEWTRRRNGE